MNDLLLSSDFIQANRVLRLTSPLGDDQLLPERLSVEEGVNQLFEMKLSVRAKREAVRPEELIGNLVTIDIEVAEGIRRPFNGLVTKLSEGPPVTRGLRSYTLTIRPQMWLLSRRSDCRIWMDKTTIEILQELFSEHGLPSPDVHSVSATPRQHYSVQWNETDLDYVLRRFEEDGLFYWFEHENGSHRLKVANGNIGWSKPSASAEGELQVRLAQGSSDRNHINEWMREFAYIPGKRSGADWNFETPNLVPQNVTHSLVQMPGAAIRELYEYPARIPDVQGAERAEKLRMQAAEADHERITGHSNVRILESGRRFIPYEVAHPDHTYEEHVIVKAAHTVVDRSYETNANEPEYGNEFEAIPSRVPMTPHRQTKRPRIKGSQVAIVAGPSGEEIHTDKYGRIKVWFPWDRRAKKDGSDTCWCRVSQPWGGGTWGSQVIPRIGMEVIVSFVDGDPDRPLVIGVVPNPSNPVPYDLPGNKTRMVMRSNTHKGTGFNEMTFEDEAGKENMFFHAQKDQTTRVLNDRTKRIDRHEVASVGGNRAVEVSGNQKHEIGGSVNTVVGGTGPMAMMAMAGVQALSGQTADLLSQAAQFAGGGGPGVAAFATTLASSALGFLGAGGMSSREGVVSGPSPRSDAGTALAGAGTGVGTDASGLFPLPGIMNTIIGAFQSTSVGVAKAEQIGVSKVTNIGQTEVRQVGKQQNLTIGNEQYVEVGKGQYTRVGEKITVKVGKLYNLVSEEKYHGEAKVWEIFGDDTILLSTKGGYIELNSTGIRIHGLKIDIEGNQINFKKGGPGEGASCMREMAKSSTPFVRG